MDRSVGRVRLAGVAVGDVRRLSGAMDESARNGMGAVVGLGGLRGADAGEHGTGGVEVDDLDEFTIHNSQFTILFPKGERSFNSLSFFSRGTAAGLLQQVSRIDNPLEIRGIPRASGVDEPSAVSRQKSEIIVVSRPLDGGSGECDDDDGYHRKRIGSDGNGF